MASRRQIWVGDVPIGGGAPVAVQSMTKTETADYDATMRQIRAIADAGGDLVRVAVPREKDVDALGRMVGESPIPVIADIHFNYTLALKAIDAGAHCIRLNPGNIGGPDKVAQVVERAKQAGTPMRIGVNSGSLPKHLHVLERENAVEALVAAAVEFVELMERLEFENFKVSIKSTSVPNTIASNRLLSERIEYPLHLGITEAGTKWSGSLKSAVGLGTLLADGVGDTVRISLSTFHAEEEVKVAWEILKALKLRERGPVLIACPTCGRLQFDMDTVVADIERRLESYEEPIEVAVLGCAVNGIGEASHADFGITGAKNEGLIFAEGKPLRKVPQEKLVDELFAEIDASLERGRTEVDERKAAEGAEWLKRIEDENADELTPERLAALEAAAANADDGDEAGAVADALVRSGNGGGAAEAGHRDGASARQDEEADEAVTTPAGHDRVEQARRERLRLDEEASPTAGRRFTRS
jgi:(E)-4-hydroxy-3-methylbut-2-enyl-diphosphate synthase